MNKTELAEQYYKEHPYLSSKEVARYCGVGGRTARRAMENVRKATPPPSRSGAKILLLDIETSPLEFFGWSLKQNGYIPHDHIIKEWGILSWATMKTDYYTPYKGENVAGKIVGVLNGI